MTLRSQITTDFDGIALNVDEFARSVTYTDSAGTDHTINAVVAFDDQQWESNDDGYIQNHEGTVTISTSTTAGISSPSVNDKITISGAYYCVTAVSNQGFGLAVLRVKSTQPTERSAGEWGRRR